MQKQFTTATTATPIRIAADFYRIPSLSAARAGVMYSLHSIKQENGRYAWKCDCYDATGSETHAANPNCKHVRRLLQYIADCKRQGLTGEQAAEIAERERLATEAMRENDQLRSIVLDLALKMDDMAAQIATQSEQIAVLGGKLAAAKLREKPAEQVEWERWEALYQSDPEAAKAERNARVAQALTVWEAKHAPVTQADAATAPHLSEQERRERAPLNGNNKGFSLFR